MRRHLSLLLALFLVANQVFADDAPSEKSSSQVVPEVNPLLIEVSGDESLLYDAIEYALKRVPNLEEVALDVVGQVPLELALADYIGQLGTNVAAKSFVRDMTKIPGAVWKSFRGTQVGGTEFRFDRGNVYSQAFKAGSKIGTIYLMVHYIGSNPETASMVANFLGEYVARFLVNAGKAQQSSGTELSFEEFSIRHRDIKWLISAIAEATPKVGVSNGIGWLVGTKLGLGVWIRSKLTTTINYVSPYGLVSTVSFWKNAENNFNKGDGFARRWAIYGTMFALRGGVAFVENYAVTYIMSPPSRIAQDIVGDFLKDSVYPWLENTVHPWLLSHMEAKEEL